jgi:hypothetical protein
MPTWAWIVTIAACAVVALGVLALGIRSRRSPRERREQLDIRELNAAARERFERELWNVQMRFVDDPGGAVREAERLAQQVMSERGYPVDDFEQRAAEISVEHPHVVGYYRLAHGVWAANERGGASTEDLRQALVNYRLLFDELFGAGAAEEPLSRDSAPHRNGVGTEARR